MLNLRQQIAFALVTAAVTCAHAYHWPDYPASAQQVVADVPASTAEASVGRYAPSDGAPVESGGTGASHGGAWRSAVFDSADVFRVR